MIKLYSFKPEFFNNNGDQGNLEVITKVLAESNTPWEITDEISEADFVLVGDSSIAVSEHYREDLLALLPSLKDRLAQKQPTLIVGRSYELLAPELGIEIVLGDRVSKFFKVSEGGIDFIGYHNSELESPKVYQAGDFIATTLFGPLLAKNPEVMARLLERWGLNVPGNSYERALEFAQKVRETTSFE